MLIKLHYLCQKYKLKLKGVLHIGAHMCEERADYFREGLDDSKIIWIEGNSNIVKRIRAHFPKAIIWDAIISDEDNIPTKLHVANNGQSSSILDFGTHAGYYRDIKYVNDIVSVTKTVKTLYKENNISNNFANFLNIDIQGAELLALKGMNVLLNNFDYLYLEINEEELYQNCNLVSEIDEYVAKYGFTRIETKMTEYKWGDAFYMRKK